eukprot:4551604-Prymnesium_polylepis.2
MGRQPLRRVRCRALGRRWSRTRGRAVAVQLGRRPLCYIATSPPTLTLPLPDCSGPSPPTLTLPLPDCSGLHPQPSPYPSLTSELREGEGEGWGRRRRGGLGDGCTPVEHAPCRLIFPPTRAAAPRPS